MEMNFNNLPDDIKNLIFKSKPFKKERKEIRREIKENKRIYDGVIYAMNHGLGFEFGRDDCEYSDCYFEDIFEEVNDWNSFH